MSASARLPTLPCWRDAWPGLPAVQVTLHFASSSSLLTSTSIAPLIYGAVNCSQTPKCRVETDHHMIDSLSQPTGRDGGGNGGGNGGNGGGISSRRHLWSSSATGSNITVCDGNAMMMRFICACMCMYMYGHVYAMETR